jgi:hypothetical protein
MLNVALSLPAHDSASIGVMVESLSFPTRISSQNEYMSCMHESQLCGESFEQMTIKPINVHATVDSKRKLRPGGLSEQVEFLLDAFLAADKAELGATSAAIYGWCCTSCNRR